MYEDYTRQSLPDKEYRALIGSALCVFNSNNSFVIEKILHNSSNDYNWYELIDKESGNLKPIIERTLCQILGEEIVKDFMKIVNMRNRIVHSYQCTDKDGQQRLATKTKVKDGNEQFIITEQYLLDFIKANEALCVLLYQC